MRRKWGLPRSLLGPLGIILLSGISLAFLLSGVAASRPLGSLVVSPHPTPAKLVAPAPSATTSAIASFASLQLGIGVNPAAICSGGVPNCPAGAGNARVTLTAYAGAAGQVVWPSVQVAFVIETLAYDGVFDPQAGDSFLDHCASFPDIPLCEESNGVPFFVANAQQIADAIQAANPHTSVSFALVDYFGTGTDWNDFDGVEYHVDIQQFVPAQYFGAEVHATFQAGVLGGGYVYGDSDLSDNLLHSSSITALYGTIIGSGLSWSNNTHHVIVWMGTGAPRDPSYVQNYCVSPSSFDIGGFITGSACYSSGCEPSYAFANGVSPECEGWIHSQDGNKTHSIAELARTAPACTESIGHVCTVDAVDYTGCMTDPVCVDWPTGTGRAGGGPGGPQVVQDIDRELLAGCDIAAATGGTWDGPAWFTCPDGQAGTLQMVSHGKTDNPNTENPTLFAALRNIGFGPVTIGEVASGTGHPLFTYVPIGSIALAQDLQPNTTCLRNGAPLSSCQKVPSLLLSNGVKYLGWNWSTNRSQNFMFIGDLWTASFNVIATGPPYSEVPVDACTTADCHAGGSTALNGLYTWATYFASDNVTVVVESFPLGQVSVEPSASPTVGAPPPPAPPPPPPPAPIAVPAPVPLPQQIGVGQGIGVGNISLQGVFAGFIAAGFTRIGLKVRPIALRVAAKSGYRSKFETELREKTPELGHWE